MNVQITKAQWSRALITLPIDPSEEGERFFLHSIQIINYNILQAKWRQKVIEISFHSKTFKSNNRRRYWFDYITSSPWIINDSQRKTFSFPFVIEWIKPKIISQIIAIN